MFNNKLVVRAGWGMYYDRGELFTYLSPGTTQNITTGGPFGINQQLPFVGTTFCPTQFNGTFLPQHWVGMLGQPRRTPEYDPQFQFWNDVSSIMSYVMTFAILLFFINILVSLRNGKKAGPNPWVI